MNKTKATVKTVLVLKDEEARLHPQRSTLIFICGRTSTQQSVSSDSAEGKMGAIKILL